MFKIYIKRSDRDTPYSISYRTVDAMRDGIQAITEELKCYAKHYGIKSSLRYNLGKNCRVVYISKKTGHPNESTVRRGRSNRKAINLLKATVLY